MTAIPADPTKVNYDQIGDDPQQARSEFADTCDKIAALLAHLRASPFVSGNGSAPQQIGEGLENDGANNIRAKLDGSSLARSASGLKVANSGVAAASYTNASITVGADGRITTASSGAALNSGLVPLAELTLSAAASCDVTSVMDSTYDEYLFSLAALKPATDQVALLLRLSTNNGSSWLASDYDTENSGHDSNGNFFEVNGAGITNMYLSQNAGFSQSVGNGALDSLSGLVHIWPNGSLVKMVGFQTHWFRGSRVAKCTGSACYTAAGTVINAAQFRFNTGNIASGVVRCYGVKKSP